MKFRKSFSPLTRIATIAILALSVSFANSQAFRPGGMAPTRQQAGSVQPVPVRTLFYWVLLSVVRNA